MYRTSAKLTFGGGEKLSGVQKAPGGAKNLQWAQKAYKKNQTRVATCYFIKAQLLNSASSICRSDYNQISLYTRYPIVARRAWPTAFRPSASREQRYLAYNKSVSIIYATN